MGVSPFVRADPALVQDLRDRLRARRSVRGVADEGAARGVAGPELPSSPSASKWNLPVESTGAKSAPAQWTVYPPSRPWSTTVTTGPIAVMPVRKVSNGSVPLTGTVSRIVVDWSSKPRRSSTCTTRSTVLHSASSSSKATS